MCRSAAGVRPAFSATLSVVTGLLGGTRAGWLCLGFLGLMAMPGCATSPHSEASTSGPLSALGSSGTVSADPTRSRGSWQMTFGAVVLCSDAPVELLDVSYDVRHKPTTMYSTVHWIAPARAGNHNAGGVISLAGAPGGRSQQWQSQAGRFARLGGDPVRLSAPCADKPHRVELLTTVTVPHAGMDIGPLRIDYSYAGTTHQLKVDYRYVGCGPAIRSRFC